ARLTLEPGWSWSSCVKPMVGGDSCQARHVGTVIQGTMVAKHNDGTTQTFKAGDTYIIEPGHDGWVEGDEAVVAFEFNSTAAQTYAATK
ncbi:MAG: cupin domain-containing protein, partial [Pseudomonadota bacterium]|nr:cupin domain-containing protein [Pseudomonadota bacterium]